MAGVRNYDRLAHLDYRLDWIPLRPRCYGGGAARLRDAETLATAKVALLSGIAVGRVATLVGFSSFGAFSTAFRREVGVSPSVFRARNSTCTDHAGSCGMHFASRPMRASLTGSGPDPHSTLRPSPRQARSRAPGERGDYVEDQSADGIFGVARGTELDGCA